MIQNSEISLLDFPVKSRILDLTRIPNHSFSTKIPVNTINEKNIFF